jgi:hypothetical protein
MQWKRGRAKASEVGRDAGLWVNVRACRGWFGRGVDAARYGCEVVLPRS